MYTHIISNISSPTRCSIALLISALFVAGCTSSNDSSSSTQVIEIGPPVTDELGSPLQLPQIVQASLELVQDKTYRISWPSSEGADFYRVLENPDGLSGFSQIGEDLEPSIQTFDHRVALYKRSNARYIVQACNASACVDSEELFVSGSLEQAIGYFKASNTEFEHQFGDKVSLSLDGDTLAVGASGSSSFNSPDGFDSDSIYVFQRDTDGWMLQAVLNSSNNDGYRAGFGVDISLAADGNTLAVGSAVREIASGSIGENGVYVFERNNGAWQQQAFLESDRLQVQDRFGVSVSLSADGSILAVGATSDNNAASGVNAERSDITAPSSGSVYVFERSNGTWQQQVYLKSSNTIRGELFGGSVSLDSDGRTLAVGATGEFTPGIDENGNQIDAHASGTVYVFQRTNETWQQLANLQASNADTDDLFGGSVSLSSDGKMLAAGATGEDSASIGADGNQSSNASTDSGAVYVFELINEAWQQQVYLKASNTDTFDFFGGAVSISSSGNTLAVGAVGEKSITTGLNGDQNDNSRIFSGAVYVFERTGVDWQQRAYLKASNTGARDFFGGSVGLSSDGDTLAVGARDERSLATGVNGDQSDDDGLGAGAVYLY